MIPLIDLLIRRYIEEGIERLDKNPRKIREYFSYASDKTIKSVEKLVTEYRINVLSGYPREVTHLPCIVVSIAGEEEVPYGIGDGIDENYREFGIGEDNYTDWFKEENSKYIQESIQMRASIRAEIWGTDAVVTSFLYAIVKYCLLSARNSMYEEGLMLATISGGDLEPAPEYFPEFVYRRAVILDFEYTADYHVGDKIIGQEDDHFPVGTKKIGINVKGVAEDGEETS